MNERKRIEKLIRKYQKQGSVWMGGVLKSLAGEEDMDSDVYDEEDSPNWY